MTTTWRGVTLDDRTAAMMNAVVGLCPGISIVAWQGSYSTALSVSFGTHAGGGAIDIGATRLTPTERSIVESAMRRVGFAAWVRAPWEGDWDWHIHGIAVGCSDLSTAAAGQVTAYMAGRNGLAGGRADTGDRTWVGQTWENYLAGGGPPGVGSGTGTSPGGGGSWLTTPGTFLDPLDQDIVATGVGAEARFAPPRLVAA